jgi:hypothetical protein
MQHVTNECKRERPPEAVDHQACETALTSASCSTSPTGESLLELPEACGRYAGVCSTQQSDGGSDAQSD